MHKVMLSVGVDIGTSTTQLVFSRLTMENRAGSSLAPQVRIVGKEVVYRSPVYFTPLRSEEEIDAEEAARIVRQEYRAAGVSPQEVETGAVIITGETARKRNAAGVLEQLSGLAGDFVVAAAGPALESVLSARGAGIDRLSASLGTTVVNLDIGGGTSNLAVYDCGELRGVSCLDLGGRLVKVSQGRITYVYPKLGALAAAHGIRLEAGGTADRAALYRVCALMAGQLAQALRLEPRDGYHEGLYTNGGAPLPEGRPIRAVTFSGGVADCIYQENGGDCFRYGDIGVLLGQAVRENAALRTLKWLRPEETIRATVVGAGSHTTEVSGSTIRCSRGCLPLRDLPVLKVGEEASPEGVEASIRKQLPLYLPEGAPLALALHGGQYTGFAALQGLAAAIVRGADALVQSPYPVVLVLEADIGKALGNAVNALLGGGKALVCIDGIRVQGGDYIDIGIPLAEGSAVPVVLKTLVFNA